MTHHHLKAGPATCHWGFFDAKQKPVISVKSGDEVTVDCVSGNPEHMPDPARFHIPPELKEIHIKSERGPGPQRCRGCADSNARAVAPWRTNRASRAAAG